MHLSTSIVRMNTRGPCMVDVLKRAVIMCQDCNAKLAREFEACGLHILDQSMVK